VRIYGFEKIHLNGHLASFIFFRLTIAKVKAESSMRDKTPTKPSIWRECTISILESGDKRNCQLLWGFSPG